MSWTETVATTVEVSVSPLSLTGETAWMIDTDATSTPVRVEYTWAGSSSRVASLSSFGEVASACAHEEIASVAEEEALVVPHPSVGSAGSQSAAALGASGVTVGVDSTFTPLDGE